MQTPSPIAEISHESSARLQPLLVRLLQGIVFFEDAKIWQLLLTHESQVRRYFQPLGLHLYLSHEDGFAFLKTARNEEDVDTIDEHGKHSADDSHLKFGEQKSLVRRFPLSYDVSLLCVLLREALEQFDTHTQDDHRLIVKAADIYEMLRTFYPDTQDLAKQQRRFDSTIGKLEDLLFLKRLEGQTPAYEVRRVIKAFIDGDCVQKMKQALKSGRGTKDEPNEEILT